MRRTTLSELAERPFEVLVVGGGIYGAMVARDAALRGLRTALIEKDDFGAGISHNSMKVMHGGIRYVQHLDFGRLRDSARERAFWQRCAARHVGPLEFLIPLTGWGLNGPAAFGAAAALYAAASAGLRGPGYPAPRVLSPRAARARLGALAPRGLTGGGLWRDGQIRDADRLQLACVAAAVERGCAAANHVEAVELIVAGDRVAGVRARDRLSGEEGDIRAAVTVSATGPAACRLARAALPRIPAERFPRFARALNLLTTRAAPRRGLGLVSRARSDAVVDRGNRLYFLTPWEGGTIFGTHEAPHEDGADWPSAAEEARGFLAELNHACPALDLAADEVSYVYAGLIPADVDDARGELRRQTRGTLIDHLAADGVAGLVTAIGIKYTTARLIGERAVDLAAAQLDRQVPPSPSLATPLPEVACAALDPGDAGALAARIRTAVADEMALTLDDVLVRRTRLAETGALAGPRGAERIERAARLLGDALGWDAPRRAAETASLERVLARHRPRRHGAD